MLFRKLFLDFECNLNTPYVCIQLILHVKYFSKLAREKTTKNLKIRYNI